MSDKKKNLTPQQDEMLARSRRLQRLNRDLSNDRYDRRRDHEFAPPVERIIRQDDIEALADVLVDTDDSLSIGLSQVGIDPDEMSAGDRAYVVQALKDIGVRFNKHLSCWCRD